MGLSKAVRGHGQSLADSQGPRHGTNRKQKPHPQVKEQVRSLSLPGELSPPFLVELKHCAASNALGLAVVQTPLMSELAGAPDHPVSLQFSGSTHLPGLAGF